MMWRRRTSSRREEIRRKRRDLWPALSRILDAPGVRGSVLIAAIFFLATTAILTLRDRVVPYRIGQYVAQDILARVDFDFPDRQKLENARQDARDLIPHVYKTKG